jgi:UPF0755 protein
VRQPTPYNTYVISGLPPGPIANPGRAAMEATANPSRTRDLFFVADGAGGHAFSETLDQHNRNVARWRQIERPDASASPPSVPTPTPLPRGRPGQRSELIPPGLQLRPREGGQPVAPTAPKSLSSAFAYAVPQAQLDVFGPGGSVTPGFSGTLDEPQASPNGTMESFPVAPGRRQSMQRNVQQSGQPTGQLVQSEAFRPDAGRQPSAGPRGQQRGFDAVEGTDRDPLRNKTFDLTSPKTIPQLR